MSYMSWDKHERRTLVQCTGSDFLYQAPIHQRKYQRRSAYTKKGIDMWSIRWWRGEICVRNDRKSLLLLVMIEHLIPEWPSHSTWQLDKIEHRPQVLGSTQHKMVASEVKLARGAPLLPHRCSGSTLYTMAQGK